jgi:hypothetical protein
VQPPRRVGLSGGHHVAGDVVGPGVGGIAVHGNFQIRAFFVRLAPGCQQARNADEWCLD